MHSLEHTLEALGLSEKEISIYLALLAVGTSPASTLGQRTGITRSTAQYTCQQLSRKGLIRMIQRGNTYLYTPEPPEKLLLLLKSQQDELKSKEDQVHRIIGTLKGMMNPQSVLPKIRFFEGRDGIIAAYNEVLQCVPAGGEIVGYLKLLDLQGDELGLQEPLAEFVRKRETKGVRARIIAAEDPIAADFRRKDPQHLRETRLASSDRFDFPSAEIMIYGDRISSMTVERNQIFAYVIENESITRMHRALFELLWERLPSGR